MTDDNLVLVMTKVFRTSPERLFDAWTKPELAQQWFHARPAWTTPVAEMDLKEGGAWKVDMRTDQGGVHHALGHYRTIERPHRLSFTWHPYADTSIETLVTLRFKALPDGTTEMTLTHEGLRNEKMKGEHQGGWTGCLECLYAFADKK